MGRAQSGEIEPFYPASEGLRPVVGAGNAVLSVVIVYQHQFSWCWNYRCVRTVRNLRLLTLCTSKHRFCLWVPCCLSFINPITGEPECVNTTGISLQTSAILFEELTYVPLKEYRFEWWLKTLDKESAQFIHLCSTDYRKGYIISVFSHQPTLPSPQHLFCSAALGLWIRVRDRIHCLLGRGGEEGQ